MSKIKKNTVKENPNANDGQNLLDSVTIRIKEEIEPYEDDESHSVDYDIIKDEIAVEEPKLEERSETIDDSVNLVKIKQENDDLNVEPNTDDLESHTDELDFYEDTQIKDEITIEEAKVEECSEIIKCKRKYSCQYCKFCTSRGESLYGHIRNTHPEKSTAGCHPSDKYQASGNQCNICLAAYEKGQWDEHKDRCLGRLLFSCGTCENIYVNKEGLLKHLDEHGTPEDLKVSSISETRIKERFICCMICEDDRAFRKDPYWTHVKEQHDGHYLRCRFCGKTFSRLTSRDNHVKKYCRLNPQREVVVAEILQCPEYSKSCSNKVSLSRHMLKFHRKTPCKCDDCGVVFPNWDVLKYHKMKAHTEPSHSCSYCAVKFHVKGRLRAHMASHERRGDYKNEQMKFQCQTCLKRFNREYNFKRHLTLHDRRT